MEKVAAVVGAAFATGATSHGRLHHSRGASRCVRSRPGRRRGFGLGPGLGLGARDRVSPTRARAGNGRRTPRRRIGGRSCRRRAPRWCVGSNGGDGSGGRLVGRDLGRARRRRRDATGEPTARESQRRHDPGAPWPQDQRHPIHPASPISAESHDMRTFWTCQSKPGDCGAAAGSSPRPHLPFLPTLRDSSRRTAARQRSRRRPGSSG